jgi:hypothetical protein
MINSKPGAAGTRNKVPEFQTGNAFSQLGRLEAYRVRNLETPLIYFSPSSPGSISFGMRLLEIL